MKRFLLALAAILLAMTACEEIEIPAQISVPDTESMEIFNTGISFEAHKEGGVQTAKLSFETTYKWSVSITEMSGDWLTVDPMSGEGGPATITVSATDNTDTAPRSATITVTCLVVSKTVKVIQAGAEPAQDIPAQSIKITPEVVTELKVGETIQLTAVVEPENSTDKVEWASLMEENATVKDGLVTALKEGYASITATAGKASATCRITIKAADDIEGITVTPATVTINATESTILTATVTPEGAEAVIEWFSDNTDIATVEKISDTQAKVTGVGEGTVKVIASVGSVFGYSEVTVEKKGSGGGEGGVEMISLNKTELQLGFYETFQLVATLRPEDASAQISWTSSNEDVVLVSDGSTPAGDGSIKPAGTVIAKNKEGQSIVTATVGSLSASCTVTVTSGSIVPVQSISLNKTELTLQVGQQFELIATILPGNATNKQVSWASSARSYQLSLADNGLSCVIGALAECEATITVRSADNPAQLYATCKVTVTGGSSDPGEEVVDLGLPSGLKWRGWNVGASKPEEYGDYFAWAETSPKSSYSSSNYKYKATDYGDGMIVYAKYDSTPIHGDGKTVLEPEDDAASVNLGNGWRTPTFNEFKELRENCTWKWTTRNGVNGMLVTGPNGKSIFLPGGGWYTNTTLTGKTTYGSYWTATGSGDIAHAVDFANGYVDKAVLARSDGRSVRPVKD